MFSHGKIFVINFLDKNSESVSIPLNPKSTRPVGYAFVDLSTPSEADRAVTELNGKSLTERQVSVQHARKPDAEGEQKTGPRNKRHNLGRHGRHNTHATSEAHNGTTTDGTSQTATNGAAGDATKHTTSDAANKTRKPKPVSVQTQRPKRSLSEGTDSTVKVMIANLPFDITEDKLKDYFKEYQPVAVKIALRPIPKFMAKKLAERGEARKGRGFAFVTLASEEMQQKAIHEKDQGEIDGRTVTVKVAVDMPPQDDASPVTHSPVDGTTTQDATPAATS